VGSLFANAFFGSTFSKYVPGTGWTTNTFEAPNWTSETETLDSGEGGIFRNGANFPVTITMCGQVMEGNITNAIPTNHCVLSYMKPKGGSLRDLGFPEIEGDVVYKYVPSTDSWDTYVCTNVVQVVSGVTNIGDTNSVTMYLTNLAWLPENPTFVPGEAFAVDKVSTTDWVIRGWQVPSIGGPYGPEIVNCMYDDTIGDRGSWAPEASYFLAYADPGTSWYVEASDTMSPSSWVAEAQVTIDNTGVVLVGPLSNRAESCFFRLHDASQMESMQLGGASMKSTSVMKPETAVAKTVLIPSHKAVAVTEEMSRNQGYYSLAHPEIDAPIWPPDKEGETVVIDGRQYLVDLNLWIDKPLTLQALRSQYKSSARKSAPAWLMNR